MITIRNERAHDRMDRDCLLDCCLGRERRHKVSERLRENRLPAHGLAFVAAENGRLIGTVRLWNIIAGSSGPALLLGPLAVAASERKRGIGGALVRHALGEARRLGHRAVLLVGDAAYYARFGFSAEPTGALELPGSYDRARFLAVELDPGTLAGARGPVCASGRLERAPASNAEAAGAAGTTGRHRRRSASGSPQRQPRPACAA